MTFFGYIDLGSGSYLFQLLIAGLLTSLFHAKILWGKILRIFRRMREGKDQPGPSAH